MHRTYTGLAHAAAWTCATGAAVTLSWWGVHTVMSGTAYDPPKALPLTASQETTQQATDPKASSSTQRPKQPSKSGSSNEGTTSDEPPKSAGTGGSDSGGSSSSSKPSKSSGSSPSASSSPAGDVKGYNVSGGRVVFEIHADSAELVSATPNTGWQMQIWKQPQQDWIRVTFTQGNREVSVFCTWHDHAPQVEIDDP
ncbi:hypothetical protein [Streptomyces indicus]|uniref:Secreted protein n=1 Tax=Streptomyces indicus TaxID=417292 RepID=A0A1G9G794_9ACTN|nr:hypothetical protein [Streptomyces indicus]SDK96442.1 hypothetical protein SAMN05421806_11517 [Streptomyces indicus]